MENIKTAIFEEIKIGDFASFSKATTDELVLKFAEITGDFNPIHVDDKFAKKSMFGRRLVHGAFSLGLISCVLGTQLPGSGALYLDQYCKFKKPVFIGDTLTATVQVKDKIIKKKDGKPSMQLVILDTIVKNQKEEVVTEGKATVMIP